MYVHQCGLFIIMADDHVTNKCLATSVSDGIDERERNSEFVYRYKQT